LAVAAAVMASLAAFVIGDAAAAYVYQVICNSSKALAWMFNNVLRTKFGVSFGEDFSGICKVITNSATLCYAISNWLRQTFLFTALPFVVPEYLFNFASMNRARAAGLTLPYLLNVLHRLSVSLRGKSLGRWAWSWTRLSSMLWHTLQVELELVYR
jgi:hypothetical protein